MKNFKGWLAEKKTKGEIGKPGRHSDVLVVSDIASFPAQVDLYITVSGLDSSE